MNWELYTARLLVNGSTQRDRNINTLKSNIDRYGIDLPSYKTVTINGQSKNLFINSTKDPYKKTFNDQFQVISSAGAIITWDNINWIVEKLDKNVEIYPTGQLTMCNYTLNFISTLGTVISRSCVIYDNSGDITTEDKMITIGDGKLRIKLPFDSETKTLTRNYSDGVSRRLLIGNDVSEPTAYRIVKSDNIILPGCVILTLDEDVIGENDNTTLMVADYNRLLPVEPTPTDFGLCKITYSGDSVLEIGKGYKTFTPIFKDKDGNILTEIVPVWDIVLINPEWSSYVVSTIIDNVIKIKITDNQMLGSTVRLNLKDADNTVSSFILLEVVVIG